MEEIIERLAHSMLKSGITKKDIAEETGLAYSTICTFCNGNHRLLVQNYMAICAAAKVDPTWLWYGFVDVNRKGEHCGCVKGAYSLKNTCVDD